MYCEALWCCSLRGQSLTIRYVPCTWYIDTTRLYMRECDRWQHWYGLLLSVCVVFNNQLLASGVVCLFDIWFILSYLLINGIAVGRVVDQDKPDSGGVRDPTTKAPNPTVKSFAEITQHVFPAPTLSAFCCRIMCSGLHHRWDYRHTTHLAPIGQHLWEHELVPDWTEPCPSCCRPWVFAKPKRDARRPTSLVTAPFTCCCVGKVETVCMKWCVGALCGVYWCWDTRTLRTSLSLGACL